MATAASSEFVASEVSDGVATIRLTNGDGRNVVSPEMAAHLQAAIEAALDDDDARVLLTVADGPAWCAGGDLKSMGTLGDGAYDFIREAGVHINACAYLLHESPKPTIAAVHGAVAGGGLGLMAAHDLVVAAESTAFTYAYGAVGLSPDVGGTWFVVRDIGYRRALELYLRNQKLDAAGAKAEGLVTEVVGDDELRDAANKLAATLAAGPADAFATTKRLMRESAGVHLRRQLEDEIRALADGTRGAEFAEGLAAFGEKRSPDFTAAAQGD